MPLRTCAVTFTDPKGVRHTAEVATDSLFETALLAIQILKRDGWVVRGLALGYHLRASGRRGRAAREDEK
jgi:hypothetical protein